MSQVDEPVKAAQAAVKAESGTEGADNGDDDEEVRLRRIRRINCSLLVHTRDKYPYQRLHSSAHACILQIDVGDRWLSYLNKDSLRVVTGKVLEAPTFRPLLVRSSCDADRL